MRKIVIISFFALLIMQACKKDQELIDGKKPEERVSEAIEKYSKELTGSTEGWVATLKTNLIEGDYSFYIKFGESNRVSMWADYEPEEVESTYRLKYVMAPSIIFDTYSTLHLLQDPNEDYFGGEFGQGYGSDFEFEIREQMGDTIKLIGKKRLAELILVKATAADKDFYTNKVSALNTYVEAHPYLYINDPADNTKRIQISVNTQAQARTISLISLNSGVIKTESEKFTYTTKNGLALVAPLVYNGITIVEVNWDNANNKFFLVTSTGTKIEVLVSAIPIIPLHFVMGTSLSTISMPGQATFPGSGQTFVTAYTTFKASVAAAFSTPTIVRDLNVVFNATSKTMTISINVVQNGTSVFPAVYTYNYTKTESGEYKFSGLVSSGGGAAAVLTRMRTFILNRIEAQTFLLDYYDDQANQRVLGKFSSKETPDFSLTGTLK